MMRRLTKYWYSTSFISRRLSLFQTQFQQFTNTIKSTFTPHLGHPRKSIKVTLPDGKCIEGKSYETTPLMVAKEVSNSVYRSALVAKVTSKKCAGQLWDLNRPLEADTDLQILSFEDAEGKNVFWHSAAHVLGQALERLHDCFLANGPSTNSGFFYDSLMPAKTISQSDFLLMQQEADKIIAENQHFDRCEMTKEAALEMFAYNPFKLHYLRENIGDVVTAYRCGNFVDLCLGPHITRTGIIGALKITKSSAAQSSITQDTLQRVYGISFPSKKQLKQYEKDMEEAEKRDHRVLGKQQELFFFNETSPGSCFFHPDGTIIYNKLIDFMRKELRYRGYQEVITPNLFNIELWKTSGHYENFKEDMFAITSERQEMALKPMNCPGHCLLFKERLRSYKELPLRYSEFAVLHRNEHSGALAGLSRVRRFVQDDAHVFVQPNGQVGTEVDGCLDLVEFVYGKVFGMETELVLSTKPCKSIGTPQEWERAEKMLMKVLEERKSKWQLNTGDGAFYGPKIDILIKDAQGRSFQTGTIQLDFQLPRRFSLKYKAEQGFEQPVIIHRTVLGSIERFMGIYIEACAGLFPFWLSPRQVKVVPVAETHSECAKKLCLKLRLQGYEAALDDSNMSLAKKIRKAQIEHYNYAVVIGDKEMEEGSVDIRERGGERSRKTVEEFMEGLESIKRPPASEAERHLSSLV
eukprot:TRINITY_DN4505_c0_g1_i27.p1 TRINITY_DN4505_c0_g1~~TRINITY_DN4505_c0_g1_i27.p1  ORF type:complete len:693 (-),score=153.31 TRINITY_DN4505_c0_g1_i27:1599-3677(-)